MVLSYDARHQVQEEQERQKLDTKEIKVALADLNRAKERLVLI
jgi:hypothetical protein